MTTNTADLDLKRELDVVIAQAGADIPAAHRDMFTTYVHDLYHDVPVADIMAEPAAQHVQRVSGFWNWADQRAAGSEPHLRLHNPPAASTHWRTEATFIEIISEDMPFLVDSISAELARMNLPVRLLLHPVFSVKRDETGTLIKLQKLKAEGFCRESWIHVTLDRLPSEKLEGIRAMLLKVLADVKLAVSDWQDMRATVHALINDLPGSVPKGTDLLLIKEVQQFLEWLDNDHFVFLGSRDYKLSPDGTRLEAQPQAARGLLRDSDLVILRGIRRFDELPESVRSFLEAPDLIFVNKAQARSTVHRPAPYDIIGIKHFGPDGRFIGLRAFIGLFTSLSYARTAQDVPWLRQKVTRMLERSHLDPRGHSGKALIHILNTYPRDDLFQIGENDLYAISRGILMLAERSRTALFVWRDQFNRFVSCLIYTPRDRFDTALRRRFIALLEEGFNGRLSSFATGLGESHLVRLQVTIDLAPETARNVVDTAALEKKLIDAARGWDDGFIDALMALYTPEEGRRLRTRYGEAFPAIYRTTVPPERAAADIAALEAVQGERPIAISLHALPGQPASVQLRLFHRDAPLALSDVLPRLENMGLRIISEVPYPVAPQNAAPVWISELQAESRDGSPIVLDLVAEPFVAAFHKLWDGELEDDRFNQHVLHLGLDWREVSLLRAYAKYLQQARFTPTPSFIRDTLASHANLVSLFIKLFHAQFDPLRQKESSTVIAGLLVEIDHALESVTSLAEDEVLRRYVNLIRSTLRTNYYQTDEQGQPKPYVALKLDSQALTDLPLPRPLVEIWVYSPRVEGVHLRGGRVARGGIRWSDRRDDFRTEVLGLMKAQQVKNSVIVPVGSKGGFYCKHLPTDRNAEQKEVIACYQTFIRGLLDVTDNRVGDGVLTPRNVVRRDGDDPYLVVAADKGTAKFSDIANAISLAYGFWLGDAFASGGSAGYDHKHMGITARGAWEAVKRHFRELGTDIQSQDFTCVGVGDMAGDVFGNGLLRSPHTLLVGAFNHKHIFLDPHPDAESSFAERKRLFELPGSQWSDYDVSKISKGGAVYERSAKSLAPSAEVRQMLGLEAERVTPNELIKALLKANVDLLYLGGIGTYVKASTESHADVSDKANDAVRVNGNELRAKVIGEGANLGVTARARVEIAIRGGHLNSDAIDNSAGVDTSDHEVNIKIALQPELAKMALTLEQRNHFLTTMTDDVAGLVLRDNYLQTQNLTLEQRSAALLLDQHARVMQTWEKAGRLDRAVEFLPSDEQIAARAQAGMGLTRPEIAIVMAYAKLALCDEVVRSTLPDEPVMEADLFGYFPLSMQKDFAAAIKAHRLRREIIATVVVNDIVNRMGSTFINALAERSGTSPIDVIRAYLVVRQVFALPKFWSDVEALDNKVPASVQLDLLQASQSFAARTIGAVLSMATHPLNMTALSERLSQSLAGLSEGFDQLLPSDVQGQIAAQVAQWKMAGVPEALALRAARLVPLSALPDILVVAGEAAKPAVEAAQVYYAVGQRFGLDVLRQQALSLRASSHWQRQEALARAEDLFADQQRLAVRVLQGGGNLANWLSHEADSVERVDLLLNEIKATPSFDLSMLAMASRSLRSLSV